MQYKITSIEHASVDGMAVLRVESNDDEPHTATIFTVPIERLVEAIVELNSMYDISASNLNTLVPTSMHEDYMDLKRALPHIIVAYDVDEQKYAVRCKDGDAGSDVVEFGSSVAKAIAHLATRRGFKSKLSQGGPLTLAQWFADFDYGFDNISQDLLRAELEGITTPNKGSW